MQTVPITIEDATFAEMDAAAKAVGLSVAEFVRRAAEAELARQTAANVGANNAQVAAPAGASPVSRDRPPTREAIAQGLTGKPRYATPSSDLGKPLLASLDDIDAVLRIGEGEDYK